MPNDGRSDPLGVVFFVDGDAAHDGHVEALRAAGYRVEVAASALEALDGNRDLQPHAVIVPLLMPDMTGTALAHRFKAMDGADTPAILILLPADSPAHAREEPLRAGATLCELPCDAASLVKTVARLLAARSA